MRNILRFILFFLLQLYCYTAFSQILYSLERKQNAISLTNGINKNESATTLSYARGLHFNIFNKIKDDITLFLDFTDQSDFRNDNTLRMLYGGQASLFKRRSFMILFRKTFAISKYRLPHNVKATYLGAEFEFMPGIYKSTFFVALDLYYGDKLRGYITSEGSESTILKETGRGWFKPRQATFRTGINAGYHLKNHWTIFGNIDLFVIRPHSSKSYYLGTPLVYGYMGVNYVFSGHAKIVAK